ncbi:hypothetical protein [Pseudomonas fluorescens]|nr:hypothetical protein [Pseudomonas fluorescens]
MNVDKNNKILAAPIIFSLLMLQCVPAWSGQATGGVSNDLTAAVAWRQTAAEFEAYRWALAESHFW